MEEEINSVSTVEGCKFIKSKAQILSQAIRVEHEFSEPAMVSRFLTYIHDSFLAKARQQLVCYPSPFFSPISRQLITIDRAYSKKHWPHRRSATLSKEGRSASCWRLELSQRQFNSSKRGQQSCKRRSEQWSSK